MGLVNSYPVSAVINKLQQASIPSNDAACLKELGKRDVRFRRQGDFSEPKGCKVKSAVRLSSAGQVQFDNAPLLSCKMAMQLAKFSEDELQSSARDVLGTTVKRVHNIGTYNCRSMLQLDAEFFERGMPLYRSEGYTHDTPQYHASFVPRKKPKHDTEIS